MQCTTMQDVVPLFLKEVHQCLDYMDQDMKEFMQHKDHPSCKKPSRDSSRDKRELTDNSRELKR